jgi:hypothetical protein
VEWVEPVLRCIRVNSNERKAYHNLSLGFQNGVNRPRVVEEEMVGESRSEEGFGRSGSRSKASALALPTTGRRMSAIKTAGIVHSLAKKGPLRRAYATGLSTKKPSWVKMQTIRTRGSMRSANPGRGSSYDFLITRQNSSPTTPTRLVWNRQNGLTDLQMLMMSEASSRNYATSIFRSLALSVVMMQ